MLAAVLLAACAQMPSYGGAGTCSVANQSVECWCDECVQWDIAPLDATHSEPVSYTVQRVDRDGTVHTQFLMSTVDVDGTVTRPVRVWCGAKWDESMPLEGRPYKYWVKSCGGDGFCNDFVGPVLYIAAPYCVDAGCRHMVQGN
jgi:hypothetical protein